MESSKALIVTPDQREAALNVVGTKVTVLGAQTAGGGFHVTLQSGDEGTGPPPHTHDWDESFYVTKGQVLFTCDGVKSTCDAGTFVHVPAGTVHAFSYGPGGGEMLEVTGKGSNAIQMFRAVDREIEPGPPDVPKIVDVLAKNGVTTHL